LIIQDSVDVGFRSERIGDHRAQCGDMDTASVSGVAENGTRDETLPFPALSPLQTLVESAYPLVVARRQSSLFELSPPRLWHVAIDKDVSVGLHEQLELISLTDRVGHVAGLSDTFVDQDLVAPSANDIERRVQEERHGRTRAFQRTLAEIERARANYV